MARRSKTVASQVVHHMMLTAQRNGLAPEEFTRRTGISLEEARDPRERIGRPKFERGLAVMQEVVGPAPPFLVELGWFETSFPMLAAAWLNAPSARAAVHAFLRYRPLVGESDWMTVHEREGRMRIEYVAEAPEGQARPASSDAAAQAVANFGLLAQIIRHYDQERATRFTAQLAGPPPRSLPQLEALLCGRVEHGQPTSALCLEASGLDVPFPRRNPTLDRILGKTLDEGLAELDRHASLALTVERALGRALTRRSALPTRQVLEHVCADLRMTRWTLWRRLAEEGVTFKELHARMKLREARRMLECSPLSLAEVSDRLGFTSPSSFTRFFRSGVGMTPQQYRRASDER